MERRKIGWFLVVVVALLALGSANTLFGQVGDRAVITGLVTDTTGAAVPDAKVTLIDQATSVKTPVATNAAGNYSSPNLILGTYTVQVEKEGFKTYVRSGIALTGGQVYRQDVELQLGMVTQTVEVTSAPEMIHSENATVSHTIGQSYYQDLPAVMGADIRLAESLLQVQPGYIPMAPNGDAIFRGSQFQSRINGGQSMATENWFDGAAFGYAEGHGQTQESSLPYSAVKEMTVVENTFSAQYGHTSGGFIEYTTKSGTNGLHGQIYDIYTSGHLDARNTFLPNVLPLFQNNWGAAVGGPVVIPKIYNGRNKTFFFTNLDALNYHSIVNTGYVNTLPLQPQRNGDFSALLDTTNVLGKDALGRPIYAGEIFNPATTRQVNGVPIRDGYGFDPVTGLPINGAANIIPSAAFSQVSSRYVPLIPAVDRNTLTQNEFGGTSDDNNLITVKTWLLRIDHTFNDKLSMSDTFYLNKRPRTAHCGGPGGCNTQADGQNSPQDNTNYIGQGFFQRITNRYDHLQFSWVLKPNLFNHTTLAYDRWVMMGHSLSGGVGWPQKLGISGIVDQKAGPPSVNFSGVTPYTSYGTSWYTDGADINNRYQVLDDLTWITGKHTLKAGMEYRYVRLPQDGWAVGTGGTFNFNRQETGGYDLNGNSPQATGDPFASLLLGQVDNAGYTIPTFYAPTQTYGALWANDEFKVTSRLTLSLGIRFDHLSGLSEQYNRFSTFSATTPNPGANNIPGAMIFAGKNGAPSAFDNGNWNVGPRLGIAYRLNNKTAIRGGYGIYYAGVAPSVFNPYPVDGYNGNPSVPNTTGGLSPAFNWDNGFPQAAVQAQIPPIISPTVDNGKAPTAVAHDGALMPRYQNWSLSLQRQLTTNMSIDVAYVGNHGTRLIAGSTYGGTASNMNNPKVLALGPAILNDTNFSDPAVVAAGITKPYPSYVGTVAHALLPFPQYNTTINWRNLPVGTSRYDALQVLFQRRLAEGWQFRVAYTYSRLKNDGADAGQGGGGPPNGIQNPVNIQQGEYGYSYDDVPHYLGVAWVYELPFGPGKKFGSGSAGVVGKLIGGWQLSATQVYQTGRPLGIGMANDVGGFLFNYNKRPNKVGPGLNTSWTGPQTSGARTNQQRYLTFSGWADPNVYNPDGTVQQFNFGNGPRMDGTVRGFGYFNEDLGIFKDTHISESKFIRFEADMGNVFNRVDFCNVNTNWSDKNSFGTTGSQCNIPRRIQFGLTLNF